MINILHLKKYLGTVNGITKYISYIQQNSSAKFLHHVSSSNFDNFDKIHLENKYKLKSPCNSNADFIIHAVQLLRYCQKQNIDIVHSHHRYYELISYILAKMLNIKTIMTAHYYPFNKKKISYTSDKIITVNNQIANYLTKDLNISHKRVTCINNCLFDEDNKVNVNSRYLQNSSMPVIGYIGRIDYREKGVDILLNAFKVLKERGIWYKGIIMGNGPDFMKVKDFIKLNYLDIQIWYRNDNSNFFRMVDIIVLPSRIDPFPYTMLEAANYMVPFIGSNVDGISEYIENGNTGILFENENFNELADKIILLTSNVSLRKKLVLNNKYKLSNHYSLKSFIRKVEDEYLALIKE
jgi:glycosyltransferase involved in cell wall biosynthesis